LFIEFEFAQLWHLIHGLFTFITCTKARFASGIGTRDAAAQRAVQGHENPVGRVFAVL
jgi:hypothetical protein